MIFRYARHTDRLQAISAFYTEVLGMERLGGFEDHDDYNGLFLGFSGSDWHLEFTQSTDKANHHPDDDDLLVFYLHSQEELTAILKDAKNRGFHSVTPKNPYWQQNGIQIDDPDGYGVILTIRDLDFTSVDPLTDSIRSKGIHHWDQLLTFVKNIPYGRNENRSDLKLVLTEEQGTCSSKHAFIKKIAELNNFKSVDLVMGIYKMNAINTPGIGDHLSQSGLDYLPEAHCYLKINGKRIDLTRPDSDINNIRKDLIEEVNISPCQVDTYKVGYHQQFIRKWLKELYIEMTFGQVWKLREKCIKELSIKP